MRVGQQWCLTSFRIKYRIIKGEKLDGSDTSFSLLPLFSLQLYLLLMWRILKISCSGRSSLEMYSTTLWGSALAIAFQDNRAFCKYICPITIFLKPMSYFALFRIKCDKSKCVSCGKCKKVCPMDVDVTDNSRRRKNGTECILCMECVKSCPKDAL